MQWKMPQFEIRVEEGRKGESERERGREREIEREICRDIEGEIERAR